MNKDIYNISNYKNLGEKNIISAVVHLDEGAPHMHLMFVPVVHTKDKEGKDIDKICSRDFRKGRDSLADNRALHLEVENIKKKYKEKETDMRWDYENEIKHLEKENNRLNNIIDRFYKTIDKFIEWICDKFNFGDSKELIKDFENETRTFIDPVKQMKKEEREKELSYDR